MPTPRGASSGSPRRSAGFPALERVRERVDEAVRESGAELTMLRSTRFAQNFSENYRLE